MTKSDIKEHLLTADDFTVCIKDLPITEEQDMQEFKAYLQQWVECMLKNDVSTVYTNPDTQQRDLNQNNIMNIYFGMNEYWKMNVLLQISEILKEVKTYQKRALRYHMSFDNKIQSLLDKAIEKYFVMKKEQRNRKNTPVMMFIQFQSMNGVKKFKANLGLS